MAAPFISGAFGVLASRYQDMSAVQVREVLLTTANHKNADGSDMIGWANADGKTPAEGEVSDRMGWGVPDLEKGMYGLGQFLGHFDYNLKKGHTDVWSNNITQVALEQREREDIAWLKSALKNADQFKFDGSERIDLSKLKFNISNDPADYKLTNTSTGEANKDGKEHNYDLAGIKDKNISLEDAKKWRLEYYTKRAEAIINKINGGLYDGSLTKSGEGTLVLTGDNDYDGKTTVAGGTLLAFSESIGTDHTVTVGDKGTFGVLSAYNDTFTQKGLLNSQNKDEDKLNIVIKDGGTLYIDGASDVKVQGVTFEGAKNVKFGLAGADHNKLIQVYNGEGSSVAGSFASDSALALEQSDLKKGEDFVDSLFFTVDSATLSTDKKKIEVSMKRDEGVTFQSFANGANQNSIASAIAASGNTLMGELLAASDKSQLEYVYSTLDDDFYVTARNALVTNATQVTRAVIDQASGMGEGRRAEFDEGRAHVWATGMGRWGEADGNAHSLDVDFTVGMVGAEFNVCQATKLGAFFGYGDTDYSGAQGKIDGEDKHFGIYGLTDIGNISMTYGIAYTDEDRDTTRHLGGVATSHSENASVLQGFVEGAYNFDLGVAKVSPYVGFTWARVETDDVVDGALDHNFKTEGVKDDIQIATIGARTSMPFTMGTMPVAVKADLGYSHFFGDSDGVARVQMGEGGQFATIEGSDLKGQVNFGLGIVGKVAKHATVGVSYTGAWGSDVDSHGIMGNLRINF
ncbi:autotransporter domain-containing protein [Sutterella wadsworthensis]|mgnify:FL=1